MRIPGVFLLTLSCVPLLSACVGMKSYVVRGESERPICVQMEGYPDCAERQRASLIAHERRVDHSQIRYE